MHEVNGYRPMTGPLRAMAVALVMLGIGNEPSLSQSAGLSAAGELVDPDNLRVCADPSNMPLSDKNGQGAENKLAELLAKSLGRKSVNYTYFPQVQGFVRNTLSAQLCDIIMGYPQGDELVQNTNAYYTSSYVLVTRKGEGLDDVMQLSDPRLRAMRIGIVEGTPPTLNLIKAKLIRNAKVYPLMIDTRLAPPMAEVMVNDLTAGSIGAAVLWGPMAGYYVKNAKAPLNMVPLLKEQGGSRMSYRITMGVRPSDQEWKRTLNGFIKDHQVEIDSILTEYGIPLLDEKGEKLIH